MGGQSKGRFVPMPPVGKRGVDLQSESFDTFKEAFDLHIDEEDEDSGCIKTHQLGPVLRSLGQHIGESKIEEMTKIVDPDQTGLITFEFFLKLMAKIFEDGCSDEDHMAIEAFQVFDHNNTGFISYDDARHIFGTLGGMNDKV